MLNVTLWGTRGSIPVSGARFLRYGGATTCIEVELPGAGGPTPPRVIIDCGTGLAEMGKVRGFGCDRAVMLQTHMHWDHIQGFPFFAPLFNPKAQFELWAVPREGSTLKDVLGRQMHRPTFPVGLDIVPARLSFKDLPGEGSAQLGELTITWTELWHPGGSTAYRLDYRGASFVFTGDVEVQHASRERLVEFATGADLLVMDAQYFPDEYLSRKGFGHSTITDAVEVARGTGARRLVLTHHDPSHDDTRLDQKLCLARSAAGRDVLVDVGHEGQVITVPSRWVSDVQASL